LANTVPPISVVKEPIFNPLSINFADEFGEVTAQDLVVNNVNSFDNLINFNILDENLKNFSNLDENFNNLDGSEIVNQIDQIVKLNEKTVNFVDTVNTVISVSGVELNEKIASLFQLFHLDISTIF
jgi:hypothetical protein